MNHSEKIYIILVNYNGWKDTIECLESIFKSNYPSFQVIVCDNASSDNSIENIKRWAEGFITPDINFDNPLKHLSTPVVLKPLPYSYYQYKDLVAGVKPDSLSDDPLILIDTGANLGFAGGNNVGARFAQMKNDYTHIWFLNNDTVIEKNAMEELVACYSRSRKDKRKTGIIGSKLLYYNKPDTIQAVGGVYYRSLAYSRHIGSGQIDHGQFDTEYLKMDYVVGASMFVSKDFIDDVGMMSDEYFIYYEETDWITRGRRKGWEIGYAYKSRVYHKEGASVGANKQKKTKSDFAVYYFFRNAIKFTKRYYPFFLISVIPRVAATLLIRFLSRDMAKVKVMVKAITGKRFN